MNYLRECTWADLTPRQKELVRLAALGLQDKEIAHQLGLSYNSVKLYFSSIRRRVGIETYGSRCSLVALALRDNLVTVEELLGTVPARVTAEVAA